MSIITNRENVITNRKIEGVYIGTLGDDHTTVGVPAPKPQSPNRD